MKIRNNDLIILYLLCVVSVIGFLTNDLCSDEINECMQQQTLSEKKTIYFILIIHHFIAAFLFFGWLFNNKKILLIYIFTPIIIVLHWSLNEWNCKLSQLINKKCNLDDSRLFPDFIDFIGLRKENIWLYAIRQFYLITVFFVSIYKYKYL